MGTLFTFEGRMNRAKYFGYSLILSFVTNLTAFAAERTDNMIILLLAVLVIIISTIMSICIAIQRLHDIERPGTHYWLFFVPFYNIYLSFLLLFKRGTYGKNQFGDDPLAYY